MILEMLFLLIFYLIALVTLLRFCLYLNLHFLKVNHDRNCTVQNTPGHKEATMKGKGSKASKQLLQVAGKSMEEAFASGRGMWPGPSPESSPAQNCCLLAMANKLCSQTGKAVI